MQFPVSPGRVRDLHPLEKLQPILRLLKNLFAFLSFFSSFRVGALHAHAGHTQPSYAMRVRCDSFVGSENFYIFTLTFTGIQGRTGACRRIVAPNIKKNLYSNQLPEFFVNLKKKRKMIVERQDNEILVRFSARMKTSRIQTILDYLRYEELTSKSTATENDINELLKEVKKGRWNRTKEELGLND